MTDFFVPSCPNCGDVMQLVYYTSHQEWQCGCTPYHRIVTTNHTATIEDFKEFYSAKTVHTR